MLKSNLSKTSWGQPLYLELKNENEFGENVALKIVSELKPQYKDEKSTETLLMSDQMVF